MLLLFILSKRFISKADFWTCKIYNYIVKEVYNIVSAYFKNRDRFIQLGITISAWRKYRGMTQNDLAEKANISRSHLSAIEAPNIVRPFSLDILFNIADALEVSPSRLIDSAMFPDNTPKA